MRKYFLSLVLVLLSAVTLAQTPAITGPEMPAPEAIARYIVYGSNTKYNPMADVVNEYVSKYEELTKDEPYVEPSAEERDARAQIILANREMWLEKYDKKYRAAKKAIENADVVTDALTNAPKEVVVEFVLESLESMTLSKDLGAVRLNYAILFDDLEIYL